MNLFRSYVLPVFSLSLSHYVYLSYINSFIHSFSHPISFKFRYKCFKYPHKTMHIIWHILCLLRRQKKTGSVRPMPKRSNLNFYISFCIIIIFSSVWDFNLCTERTNTYTQNESIIKRSSRSLHLCVAVPGARTQISFESKQYTRYSISFLIRCVLLFIFSFWLLLLSVILCLENHFIAIIKVESI